MTISEFMNEMEIMLEAEPGSITMDNQLAVLAGWDSMSIISFIAMADAKCNMTPDFSALAACKTVGDLAILIGVSSVRDCRI